MTRSQDPVAYSNRDTPWSTALGGQLNKYTSSSAQSQKQSPAVNTTMLEAQQLALLVKANPVPQQ